jgi:acetoin utilization protein AcuB
MSLQEFRNRKLRQVKYQSMKIFKSNEYVSKVLGELAGTGYYEGLVTVGNKVGLVSIRDCLIVTQPAQTTIANLVTITGSLSLNASVRELVVKLIRENIRAVPLLEEGDIIGGIDQTDLLEALGEVSEYTNIRAETVMKTPVYSMESSGSIGEVRKRMLDHNISHIPITEKDELIGIVCAKDIVQTFIVPMGAMTVGERSGEKSPRFEGDVTAIMDASPIIARGETPTVTIIQELIEREKSACIIVDPNNRIQGIITPRELLTPIAPRRERDTLPVYFVGLSDEDAFDQGIAEARIRRVVERGMMIHPHIHEVAIVIEKTRERGNQTLFELTANVYSTVPEEQFSITEEEWGLVEAFAKLAETLDSVLRRSKHSRQAS